MKRVLVATWGNPFQWEEVTYRVNCGELGLERCNDVEMKNVSTLPVLIKALQPDITIILVLDTLANLTLRNNVPEGELESYEGVKDDVIKRVEWFISERVVPLVEDEKTRELLKDREKTKIIVAPGVGEFSNASVEGNVLDFYAFVLKTLAERLPVEDTEVFLDLTHGINFMPVLTYRALKNLLGLLAYLRTARLHVLNSEPFPQGERDWKAEILKSEVLNIRSIESEELRPKPMYSIFKDLNDPKKRTWSAFISSVTNGFPLAFATFYPNIKGVKRFLRDSYSDFESSIDVLMETDETGKRKVHIVRRKQLDDDFRTATKLYYLLRVLEEEFGGKYPKNEVTLDDLWDTTKRLFAKMPRIGIVVERQLCDLEGLENKTLRELRGKYPRPVVKKLKSDRTVTLNELKNSYGNLSSSGKGNNPKPNLRNFIAHSGFEYNLVRVKYDASNKKLLWSYDMKFRCRKVISNEGQSSDKELNCGRLCGIKVDSALSFCGCEDDTVTCFLLGAILMKNSPEVNC